MNLTKIDILEKEGISSLFHNCQDLIRIVRLKEEAFLEAINSEARPDFRTAHFMAKDLSGLYSSMLSLFHDFARRVAIHFKDITKISEYLVVLSQIIKEKGVSVNRDDFRRLIRDSIDLYTNISDLLSGYHLFSGKYERLLTLITKHDEYSLGEEGFVNNLGKVIQELIPWREDLWRFVEEIYSKAQSIEKNYNYVISNYGLENRVEA
jgi:hypothetical protein